VSCELTHSVLHGYFDGELDAARAADFERHLVTCSECVAALETQEALRSSLHTAGLHERAPEGLHQRLQAQLSPPAEAPAPSPAPVVPIRRELPWRWLALAATILLLASLGWRWIPALRESLSENEYTAEVIDAHLRSLQPGHLADVISTDQHTVKPWFDGKLDFAPPVRDFVNDGFPLQGGRIDVVRGRTVAALVYTRRKHVINVFVWPTTQGDSQPKVGSQLGYHWVDWRKAGMEMCAVSDVNPADLNALQQLMME
jgi:anti-sigma factor RsiW